jgi:hypothetical protein
MEQIGSTYGKLGLAPLLEGVDSDNLLYGYLPVAIGGQPGI